MNWLLKTFSSAFVRKLGYAAAAALLVAAGKYFGG